MPWGHFPHTGEFGTRQPFSLVRVRELRFSVRDLLNPCADLFGSVASTEPAPRSATGWVAGRGAANKRVEDQALLATITECVRSLI
jgi:hypothetical protein